MRRSSGNRSRLTFAQLKKYLPGILIKCLNTVLQLIRNGGHFDRNILHSVQTRGFENDGNDWIGVANSND